MLGLLIRFASLFCLSLWVGGGAALAFLVAPTVFAHAGSRSLAGEVMGRILQRFDNYVLVLGPIALLATGLEAVGTVGAPRTMSLKLALLGGMLGLALFSRWALRPEIHRLRAAMGDLAQVPATDERRKRFGRLHGYSVLCLVGQIVIGALALALSSLNGHS
jgi:uncharacterized membrane protein